MLRSDAVYKCYAALDSALSRPQPKRAKKGTDAFSVKRLENASVPFLPLSLLGFLRVLSPRLRASASSTRFHLVPNARPLGALLTGAESPSSGSPRAGTAGRTTTRLPLAAPPR